MSWNETLLWLVLSSSLITGLAIFFLPEERHGLRSALNLTGALAKLVLIAIMLWGVFNGLQYETRYALLPGIDFALRADALAMLFVALSAVLWLFTTIYAIGYLEDSPHRSRFFGFFSLCVTSTMGIAFAGNLFTFFLFYELLTLSTYPLVVHRGTDKALRAGNIYLGYTLAGGAVLLIGIVWLYSLFGNVEFAHGGVLSGAASDHHGELIVIFALLIAGLGVKAALVPLHGWLPVAMVAPAPVSALLHAVAVVKAGAFGIVRVVYDVYGIEFAQDLGLLLPLAVVASITIVYGSLRALAQDDLKRRLAFSTVSQVSYIALGVSLFGPIGTVGGLAHLVHQGIMKITLFFCAGNLAETLGIHKVSEMRGAGRRMPWTMAAFTVAAFGMIGVPPMAGFISKWYLGLGALEAEMNWVLGVLVVSSLLNAAYFLPILYAAWFQPPRGAWPAEQPRGRFETGWRLLLPPLVTAAFTLAAGLFAATLFSPLEWAQLIMTREYVR
ncbi:MAG: monovalent cation/H+ antiporter subunit D family protein [Sulfuricaulis sp.]